MTGSGIKRGLSKKIYRAAGTETSLRDALSSPVMVQDGMSLWSRLDRMRVVGYVAVGLGELERARQVAQAVVEGSHGVELYRQRAARLLAAAADPHPADFPRLLWVSGAGQGG